MLDYLLVASSLLATLGVSALAFGYRASLFSDDMATRWFAWSMSLLAASIFWRRVMWDIIHPVVTGEVDQRPMNILVNIVTMAAVYAGLRARLALIPDEDRHRWHWWSAWRHPSIWRLRIDRPTGRGERR